MDKCPCINELIGARVQKTTQQQFINIYTQDLFTLEYFWYGFFFLILNTGPPRIKIFLFPRQRLSYYTFLTRKQK